MAARVKVRAAIWVKDKLVVYRDTRRGTRRTTLPGGRVADRESVTDGLVREVAEELGITIEVGPLLCVAEIVNSTSMHDVELVFAATVSEPVDDLDLVDPLAPEAQEVLPPILDQLARRRFGETSAPEVGLWLGNVYRAGVPQP